MYITCISSSENKAEDFSKVLDWPVFPPNVGVSDTEEGENK